MKMTVFWHIAQCSVVEIDRRFRAIPLVMEEVHNSETSADFYETTRRNIPEDSRLQCRKNR
jgi:hypothetical protein